MAQSEPSKVKILVDVSELHDVRVIAKRMRKDGQELDRRLAALEERLIGLDGSLAEHGIALDLGGIAS